MTEQSGEFIRGLSKPFVDTLNEAYARGERWWTRILEDKELYLGIRNDYLDIYYKGNRLLKLALRDGKLCGEVHYKFLLKPHWRPSYVRFEEGCRGPLGHQLFINGLEKMNLLKQASNPYVGDEKKGVHEILRRNPNIIDVEIALAPEDEPTEDEESDKRSAKKIDFAALQLEAETVRLVFFEAKHFANGELRASGNAMPSVMRQIRRYERLIEKHGQEIEKSYLQVCKNLCELQGVRDNVKRHAKLVTPERRLEVDGFPRLVIFGFDDDQRVGATWKKHLAKLQGGAGDAEPGLGKARVLMRGSANGFTKGIS